MDLRIPQEVLVWLDSVRGEKSRQAFIISILVKLAEANYGKKE